MFIKGKNFIATKKINLGLALGAEKDDDAFVVMREPTTLELMDLQESKEAAGRKLLDLIPSVLIDHDFYESENVRMTPQAVAKTITEKSAAAMKVIGEYMEFVTSPFQKPTEGK